jgi:hypothetical protein
MANVRSGIVGVLAVGSFVLLSGFGSCHGGHGFKDPARVARIVNEHVDDVLDDLDAKDDQRTKVHLIANRLVKEGGDLFATHEQAKAQLLSEWNAANPDAARVHAVIDERADGFRAFLHHVADGAIELHAILSPEQRNKLSERFHPR